MKCNNCGADVANDAVFCTGCGTRLTSSGGMGAPVEAKQAQESQGNKLVQWGIKAALPITIAVIAIVVRVVTSGPNLQNLQNEAAGLLKNAVEKNTVLMQCVNVKGVKDCCLVKESGNTYNGFANVTFQAKQSDARGRWPSAVVQYGFKIIYDGENIMLSDGEVSDTDYPKLLALLSEIAGDDEE